MSRLKRSSIAYRIGFENAARQATQEIGRQVELAMRQLEQAAAQLELERTAQQKAHVLRTWKLKRRRGRPRKTDAQKRAKALERAELRRKLEDLKKKWKLPSLEATLREAVLRSLEKKRGHTRERAQAVLAALGHEGQALQRAIKSTLRDIRR